MIGDLIHVKISSRFRMFFVGLCQSSFTELYRRANELTILNKGTLMIIKLYQRRKKANFQNQIIKSLEVKKHVQ